MGPKPSRSTAVRTTTAHNGSEVKYQNGNDASADKKNSQSVLVMELSERLINANAAMNTVIAPDTPIGHAPMPPLASSCAKKTITVVVPQITQENT